jgi:signal transduction histidine kinase
VHFGVPTEALNAPVSTSLGILIAGGVTSLLLALLLADLISRDVAQRRKQEEERAAAALAASEARRIVAVEAAQLGTWHWDHSKDLISGSERTSALLGLPIGNRAGDGLQWSYDLVVSVVDPAHRDSFQHALLQCRESNQPIDVEFSVVHPDGATRWVRLCGLAPSFAEANIAGGTDAALIHGVIVPIHARKRAEAERRDLLRRLSEAQENEQRRIARELHDQVGQTVTGLSLGLKRLEQKLAGIHPDEGTQEHMRWLQGLAVEIGRDIHRAAADLRPSALDDLGLHNALCAYVSDWSSRHGISADVTANGLNERLPPDVETAVFRALQEALTNVLKHAEARNVGIWLERENGELEVVVKDDGVGIRPPDADGRPCMNGDGRARPPRLGLLSIRERLALIGGSMRIDSAPGEGVCLVLTIPIEDQQTIETLGAKDDQYPRRACR